MLQRFLEQQPALFATLVSRELRKGEEVCTLNERDIGNCADIVKLMAPVKVVTTVMCEEKQPTISMIAPLKAKLENHFQPSDATPLIVEMKRVFSSLLCRPTTNIVATRASYRGDCIRGFRNSTFGQSAFSVKTAGLWNSIPVSIRESTTLSTFKSGLKKWLKAGQHCGHF